MQFFFDQQRAHPQTAPDVAAAHSAVPLPAISRDAPSVPVGAWLLKIAQQSGLQPLLLGGRKLLPIVQGGMGVGVSAHRLAGTVASLGGVGTIASVDLRHHHPDLLERTASLPVAAESKRIIDEANLEALSREIRMAQGLGHRPRLCARSSKPAPA